MWMRSRKGGTGMLKINKSWTWCLNFLSQVRWFSHDLHFPSSTSASVQGS